MQIYQNPISWLCAGPPHLCHGAPTQRVPSIAGELPSSLSPSFRSLRLQTSLSPAQAVTVLNDRVHHVSRLNNQIADWLQVG